MDTHDDPPLPPLQETTLDEGMLDALFLDVGALGQLLSVVVRPREGLARPTRPSLERAREALRSGEALGVQLRYRHQGSEWWDTLMPAPGGVRLVRIAHPL
jgi:hypothetical protein